MKNSEEELIKKDIVSELIQQIDIILSEKKFELPLLPEVANRVLTMANDESQCAVELSKLIHQDQILAGNILKISNSAHYHSDVKIVSLQQAITRLGFRAVGEIALTLSVKGNVFNAKGFEKDIKQIWSHSLASSAYAKEIARLKRKNVECAYLCGLLHSIGKPLILNLLTKFDPKLPRILSQFDLLKILNLRQHIMGSQLVDSWKLPQQISASIKYYQCFTQAPEFIDDVMITCLANLFATYMIDPDKNSEEFIRAHDVVDCLNFYPDDINFLFSLEEKIRSVIEMLSL